MPIELKIPAAGESITEVQISEWLKAEGDSVKQDEPVAVIDSEKASFDLPASHAGTLVKILHQAGETVAVGTVVAHLEAAGGAAKTEPVTEQTPAKPETKGAGETKSKKPKPDEKTKEEKALPTGPEK